MRRAKARLARALFVLEECQAFGRNTIHAQTLVRVAEQRLARLRAGGERPPVPALARQRQVIRVERAPLVAPVVVPVAAPPIPTWRLPWLADLERHIAQAEAHLTLHRGLAERRLAPFGLGRGANAMLQMAERRLAALQAQRQRLLRPEEALWPAA